MPIQDLSKCASAQVFADQLLKIKQTQSKNPLRDSEILEAALKFMETKSKTSKDGEILFRALKKYGIKADKPSRQNKIIDIRLFPFHEAKGYSEKKKAVSSLLSSMDKYNDLMAEYAWEDLHNPVLEEELTDQQMRRLELSKALENAKDEAGLERSLSTEIEAEEEYLEEELIVSLFNLKKSTLENLSSHLALMAKKVDKKADRIDYIARCQEIKNGVHRYSRTPSEGEDHLIKIFNHNLGEG